MALSAVAPVALGSGWHLDRSFGRDGAAGLPFRETGIEFIEPPGPGASGSLLAAGPRGSTYVGGYTRRNHGVFFLTRLSSRGTLVRGFGDGGVRPVPVVESTSQAPARTLPLADGGVLVVGLDHPGNLALVRLSSHGRLVPSFGHGGIARIALGAGGGRPLVAAATLETGGRILVAFYAHEAAEEPTGPVAAPGLGGGPLELVRLEASGAIDSSFGVGGFIRNTDPPSGSVDQPAAGVTLAADGSVALAYEQGSLPVPGSPDAPAVQELDADGRNRTTFGADGFAVLPFVPKQQGLDSEVFDGLFSLPGGELEAGFGYEADLLFRFTSSGALDKSFGGSGHSVGGFPTVSLAIAPDGETFSLAGLRGAMAPVEVRGTFPDGAPDPSLGGARGRSFAVVFPRPEPFDVGPAHALLARNHTLDVLIGSDVVRLEN